MIKAVIADFDGTLADTFEANLCAYQKAFKDYGLELSRETYASCFGLRFDDFMTRVHISDEDIQQRIKEKKRILYPSFFHLVKINRSLLNYINQFHLTGGKTAIASTARKENLMSLVDYARLNGFFDILYTGEDVSHGKPHPEIYLKTMSQLDVTPESTLIFEDSPVGIMAATKSGAHVIRVNIVRFNL